ncbi:unnamed protein product [Protopolystoma xenopodis]|uniref:Uncharacterized protein n=1 Tax=Protopolystoma xenopodis TaxID=117903 RepID=A0A448WSA0_9PLAT|nr:unnamed protein product [Protopolystoma xenopodis]
MRPFFLSAGTHLNVTGNPGENATLSCEAFGGLYSTGSLKLRLLRGPGIPKLMVQAAELYSHPPRSYHEIADSLDDFNHDFQEQQTKHNDNKDLHLWADNVLEHAAKQKIMKAVETKKTAKILF